MLFNVQVILSPNGYNRFSLSRGSIWIPNPFQGSSRQPGQN